MKNCKILRIFGIFLVIVALFIGVAMGAEYTVKNGDNLTKIGKLTGYTVQQLAKMNGVENPNLILIGQKIVFLSQKDLEDAHLWCEKKIKELNPSESNYIFFVNAIEYLDANYISYSIDEDGFYFDLILCFAKAWRKMV